MAKIRSTMDMVMERAARIAAEAEDTPKQDDTAMKGMRLAAGFLNGEKSELSELLNEQPPADQPAIRSGMAQTLLRNIILPREAALLEKSLLSLKTLQKLGGAADISAICSEIKQILDQYTQHTEQVKQQFDESILNQLKQQLMQQGVTISDDMALNATMHPHYNEKWAQVSADLNGQYQDALEQRKQAIGNRFGL